MQFEHQQINVGLVDLHVVELGEGNMIAPDQ